MRRYVRNIITYSAEIEGATGHVSRTNWVRSVTLGLGGHCREALQVVVSDVHEDG